MRRFSLLAGMLMVGAAASAYGQVNFGTLNGSIYLAGGTGTPGSTTDPFTATAITSVSDALTHVTGTPSATFLSTSFINGTQYNSNDGGNLFAFLGTDASSASNNLSPLGSFVMDIKGTVSVGTTGTYNFGTNNDDGGAFFFNGNGTSGSGTELGEVDGDHGQNGIVTGSAFLTAGTPYNVEYVYYNEGCGGCGYNGTTATGGGGATAFASVTLAPEPASISLLGLGSLSLLARRRRA